jgi:hypothetical protein
MESRGAIDGLALPVSVKQPALDSRQQAAGMVFEGLFKKVKEDLLSPASFLFPRDCCLSHNVCHHVALLHFGNPADSQRRRPTDLGL